MIYINTNIESIAHAVSLTSAQDARCAVINYGTYQLAKNVAEMADLPSIADHMVDDASSWTTERNFQAWHGGQMQQFHRNHGALLAYDNENELADVRRLAASFDAHLAELAEAEIAELESL